MIQSKHTEQFISISLSNVALVGTNQVQYHDDYSPVSLAARLCDKSMEKNDKLVLIPGVLVYPIWHNIMLMLMHGSQRILMKDSILFDTEKAFIFSFYTHVQLHLRVDKQAHAWMNVCLCLLACKFS